MPFIRSLHLVSPPLTSLLTKISCSSSFRDPTGNIQRLKDFLDKCRSESASNASGAFSLSSVPVQCPLSVAPVLTYLSLLGTIEIEARFGLNQGNSFESGMKKPDFARVVHLLESTPRISTSPLLEETNYIYHQNRASQRIIESATGELRSDFKQKFTHAHFDSLSRQVMYTLRIAASRETILPSPASITPGWNRCRQKRRREFRFANSPWIIHATEVIAKSSESNLESVSYEVELELPIVAETLTKADTERQLNELNEGISFLLHVLVCGRQNASSLSWVPPQHISVITNSLERYVQAQEYKPSQTYVPHPDLHPDSHYQRSPNGTYRGGAQASVSNVMSLEALASEASSSAVPSSSDHPISSSSFDASSARGNHQEDQPYIADHHYTMTAGSGDFSGIRLDRVRESHQIRRINEYLDSCRGGSQGGRGNGNGGEFWGTMPISFSRKYFESILKDDYHVSEKTDGVRYLMLVSVECGGVVFVNRSSDYFNVLDFSSVPHFVQTFDHTILDGELVTHQKTQQPYMLLFDCVKLRGQTVSHLLLPDRLKCIGDFISAFRHKFPDTRYHPFGILGKTVMPKSKFATIRQNITEDLHGRRIYTEGDGTKRCHLTDGLIFTPTKAPYCFRTCYTMYKWKYVDLQSIDFQLRFESPLERHQHPSTSNERNRKVELHINMNQGKAARCKTTEFLVSDLIRLAEDLNAAGMNFRSDRIIAEMAFEPKDSTWRYHRLRTDKAKPNHISIAFDTMEAIAENITLDDIEHALTGTTPSLQQAK